MANKSSTQTSRLDFRLQIEHKRLIERAASYQGQTVTDFAVATMLKTAHEVIQQMSTTTLSPRDSETFLSMLDADTQPNTALKAAAKSYKAQS